MYLPQGSAGTILECGIFAILHPTAIAQHSTGNVHADTDNCRRVACSVKQPQACLDVWPVAWGWHSKRGCMGPRVFMAMGGHGTCGGVVYARACGHQVLWWCLYFTTHHQLPTPFLQNTGFCVPVAPLSTGLQLGCCCPHIKTPGVADCSCGGGFHLLW